MGTRRTWWIVLLLLALSALASLWSGRSEPAPAPESAGEPTGVTEGSREPHSPRHTGSRAVALTGAGRQPAGQDVPGCLPRAQQQCRGGDLWWLDSCGRAHDKAKECGDQLCRDGDCELPDVEACADLPLQGRCQDEAVVGCIAGRPFRSDCAARGQRCVMGDEGARCQKPTAQDCEPSRYRTHCDGDSLLSCIEGRVAAVACDELGAHCRKAPGLPAPRCVKVERLVALPTGTGECGPCGCAPEEIQDLAERSGLEQCNGRDDDGDEQVDEGAECEPVDLVAFVITDRSGDSSYEQADLEREVQRVNRVLESGAAGLPLSVRLADTIELAEPEWRELDREEFHEAVRSNYLALPRGKFFIPVLFTDEMSFDGSSKAGVSTRPNGRCGGRRVTPHVQDLRGAVAVAKRRAPTTLAHEVGHYLGLCHTHFEHPADVQRVVQYPDGSGGLAQASCDSEQPEQLACPRDGDGLCDTPADPGPDQCSYDQSCQTQCGGGQLPDPFNVMSYYTACRYSLSLEQRTVMRETLALRQGWHRCRSPEGCACSPLAPAPGTCPAGMACYPAEGSSDHQLGYCKLQGWLSENAACTHHRECAGGALCLSDGSAARCRAPQASSARL